MAEREPLTTKLKTPDTISLRIIQLPEAKQAPRMLINNSSWKRRLKVLSWVFVCVLFPSAWGGQQTVVAVSGIICLIALAVNYRATSDQPELRWLGGLILAGPLSALIVLNAFLNPHELGLIAIWLTIGLAIYLSASIGGVFASRSQYGAGKS